MGGFRELWGLPSLRLPAASPLASFPARSLIDLPPLPDLARYTHLVCKLHVGSCKCLQAGNWLYLQPDDLLCPSGVPRLVLLPFPKPQALPFPRPWTRTTPTIPLTPNEPST